MMVYDLMPVVFAEIYLNEVKLNLNKFSLN